MKYLFYLGHPAHFHLFRPIIDSLRKKNHITKILIKKKDILEELLKELNWEYINILPKGRKDDFLSITLGFLHRAIAVYKITKHFRPDVMIGTSPEITHVGKIRGIPSVVVNEDDYNAVPLFSYLAYPFTSQIIAPNSCNVGRWKYKTISYDGYHELTYLHPDFFKPDKNKIIHLYKNRERYFLIRFANLSAHHDAGKTGITTKIASNIIELLLPHGAVHITSERELEPEFEQYRININPIDMHHALYFADMYIGDSQTMTAEAAVLGTPSIRFNDFVGKLGYLEELEFRYSLTFGIKTTEISNLIERIKSLLEEKKLKEEWQKRAKKMLKDKINVTKLFVWFLENYPDSFTMIKNNAEIQNKFK